ncbi:hypothetical protein FIBSPDRAFT_945947 [Athelia psychrophila]|uniref:Uncharacterized protein n=1 Tax=Athelia psychrophila TaxID=1759441 RepID=A0A166TH80_9AGAM|nr:hypothetical protein FIBSPDRAFT_945947 [Fibularhizoctonia sp. CBS 109695]
MYVQASSRNLTACECTLCKGVRWVQPTERRAHLKEDRMGAAAAGIGAAPVVPSSSHSFPAPLVVEKHLEASAWSLQGTAFDPDTNGYESPPLYFLNSPTPPPMEPDCATASALGMPQSPQKVARIRCAEWLGMLLEEQLQQDQGLGLTEGANDDWENSWDASDGAESAGEEAGSNEEEGPQRLDGTGGAPIPPALHGEFRIPKHKRDENDPNPFSMASRPHMPVLQEDVHPDGGVYMLYTLVAWLHSQFHVLFRACNAILVVVALIIQSFGITTSTPVLTTLPSVMGRLGVEPTIWILPVCPHCLEVYPESPKTGGKCTGCNTNIFKTGRTRGGKERAAQEPIPELKFPCKSLASQLAEIVALPGMEDKLDQWRHQSRKSGKYTDFFDGGIARDLKGPDGKQFFAKLRGHSMRCHAVKWFHTKFRQKTRLAFQRI